MTFKIKKHAAEMWWHKAVRHYRVKIKWGYAEDLRNRNRMEGNGTKTHLGNDQQDFLP